MIPKPLKVELIWFLAFVAIGLVCGFSWPKTLDSSRLPGVSLTIMDTYFSFSFLTICSFYFTVIGTVVNMVRSTITRFKVISIDLHLILFLTLFLIQMVQSEDLIYVLYYSSYPSDVGWTIYPPLSALPNKTPEPMNPQWMLIPELILIGSIFFLALRTGKLIDIYSKAEI